MTATSLIGWWYASGPADREFSPDDPEFNVHRVVANTSDVPGCVTVQNGGGQRFPVERALVEKIAAPPDPAIRPGRTR